eukprot:gene54806-52007_t
MELTAVHGAAVGDGMELTAVHGAAVGDGMELTAVHGAAVGDGMDAADIGRVVAPLCDAALTFAPMQ